MNKISLDIHIVNKVEYMRLTLLSNAEGFWDANFSLNFLNVSEKRNQEKKVNHAQCLKNYFI